MPSELLISYCPERHIYIRDKAKVVLDMYNSITKIELNHAKNDFVTLGAEDDILDIDKLVNFSTSLNNLKTKVDNLDLGKLKTFPVDLKKFTDIVDNKVVKNTKFNTLKVKVSKLDKKPPGAATLTHINQYNTDKQNLDKKSD